MDDYRRAEEELASGLSTGARVTLALGVGFCGVIAALNAEGAKSPVGVYAVSGFCFLIMIACLATAPAIRRVAGRLIGGTIFLAGVGYLISMATGGPVGSDSDSEPSLINAIAFLVAFGLPGGYYALFGRFRGEDPPSEE